MSCSEGYPDKPCPLGTMAEGARSTRKTCGGCKFYIPPPHILKWCMLWDRERVLCMKPIAECATCPEKAERPPEVVGKIDWKDPAAVREYLLKLNPTRERDKMMRFVERHPDYFKNYQEKNRAKVNENARRWYHRQKQKKEAERARAQQGGSKVQGDSP